MGKQLLMFSSITYAMKAKQILSKHNIASEIQRTPKNKNSAGCGYSLFVPNNIDEAERILKDNGIKMLGKADKDSI